MRKTCQQEMFISIFVYFRVMSTLTDIYYGKVSHPWGINIENWQLEEEEQKRIADYEKSLLARLG